MKFKTHIPNRITLHCSATKNGRAIPAKDIEQWHIQRGMITIGYHLVIQPNGDVEHAGNSCCRPLNAIGAHVQGNNIGNIGICLIGENKYTLKTWDALRYQIEALWHSYDIGPWEIRGHRQYDRTKSCPGFDIQRFTHWFDTGRLDAIKPHILDYREVL